MIEPISRPQTAHPAPGAPEAYDREGAALPAAVTAHPGQLRDAQLEWLGEAIAELSLQIDAATAIRWCGAELLVSLVSGCSSGLVDLVTAWWIVGVHRARGQVGAPVQDPCDSP